MNVVFYDAYNLIYRAKFGLPHHMQKTDSGILLAFFRSFAALNRKLQPDLAYFVTEGTPVERLQLLPEYKGNRVYERDDNFIAQRKKIIEIMSSDMPVIVANHLNHECDDILAHLVKKHAESGDDVTVVSTDTDFLQLANTIDGYKQYDPIRKTYKVLPEHDYVSWKALVGDSSDNISGFKGIGNKRALDFLNDTEKLSDFLSLNNNNEKFLLNKKLISFIDVTNTEHMITLSKDNQNWDMLFETFSDMNLKSIISNKGWTNFIDAFGGCCGTNESSR
jgi:DNA polymerase-1